MLLCGTNQETLLLFKDTLEVATNLDISENGAMSGKIKEYPIGIKMSGKVVGNRK